MGNLIDISEHKRAEEGLRESELWMRSMFNSVEEAVFLVTPDRVAVDIDETAEEVFGYPEGELVNQSSELLHVDREHYLEVGRRMNKKKNSRPNFNDPRRWRPSVPLQEGWLMTSTTCWLVY